ncbi:MAG: ABC transporter ATP-binding protein [Candidatus Marinimicrobia bacterium]|nr:ABC transporter ATP-binding protein [Candidatus Neomarinimicrobiota bacterium]|tara:strand:+ start:1570 stop:2346 length:777 start_codon:yes stop_codon:yes gene_type:complete
MIEVNNLSKYYKISKEQKKDRGEKFSEDFVIGVKNISFNCIPGRIFGLIGPNGAGKTTALRMIGTMLKPSGGNITVNGFDTIKESYFVKQRLGFLSGNTGLYDRLTAEEMVRYYADLHQMSNSEYMRQRNYLFNLLDMNQFSSTRIAKLSTGMKQKVNIARTMIHNPKVVVFDEPTSGLDIMASQNIIKLIQECKNNNKTIIFSSHRFDEIKLLCDDLAIIHNGKLFFNGTFKNFINQMKAKTLEDEFIRLIGGAKSV